MAITKKVEKPFHCYYSAIAKACNCSATYVKMVLNEELGKYSNRNNKLVRDIRTKAEELNSMFNPK